MVYSLISPASQQLVRGWRKIKEIMLLLLFLLPFYTNLYGISGTIPEQDLEIISRTIAYPGATGDVLAYMAKPKGKGSWPAVVVLHNNDGLDLATEEVVRRIASKGYYVIAPDGLSQISGTPDVHDAVVSRMDQVDYNVTRRNFAAVFDYVNNQKSTNGKIGCIGFGWGGQMAFDLASDVSQLLAIVTYDALPRVEKDAAFKNIEAPLLLHLSEKDILCNQISGIKKRLEEEQIAHDIHLHKVERGAFIDNIINNENDIGSLPFWERTIAFFKDHLK